MKASNTNSIAHTTLLIYLFVAYFVVKFNVKQC